jgi:hypothetical protein
VNPPRELELPSGCTTITPKASATELLQDLVGSSELEYLSAMARKRDPIVAGA